MGCYCSSLWLHIAGIVKEKCDNNIICLKNGNDSVFIEMLSAEYSQIVCNDNLSLNVQVAVNLKNELRLFGCVDENVKMLLSLLQSVVLQENDAPRIIDSLLQQGKTIQEICYNISLGNAHIFYGVDGISSFFAQLMVNTIKDRVKITAPTVPVNTKNAGEAVEILKSLGFLPSNIQKALANIDFIGTTPVMEIVQRCIPLLQELG